MNINARPHINGNRPEDFVEMAYKIARTVQGLRDTLSAAEMFHGRNYQHLPTDKAGDARMADMDKLREAFEHLQAVEDFALAINRAGEG